MRSEDLTESDWLYFDITAPRTMAWLKKCRELNMLISWRLDSSLCDDYPSDEYLVVDNVQYIPILRVHRAWDDNAVEYVVTVNDVTARSHFLGVINES